jgi:hypothetical protein
MATQNPTQTTAKPVANIAKFAMGGLAGYKHHFHTFICYA